MAALTIQPSIIDEIKVAQKEDPQLQDIKERIKNAHETEFSLKEDESMWYRNRICVPDVKAIKGKILKQAHSALYTAHPGSTKMYQDLKSTYWWPNMKREVALYVAHCLTCQQVKIEHQRQEDLYSL